LVQDDRLVSKLSSTNDELLYPINGKDVIDPGDVRVMIDVYIRPTLPTEDNVIFFSEDRGIWDHKYDEAIPANLTTLSGSQLRSLATQCIFRIRAMAESFDSYHPLTNNEMPFEDRVSRLIADRSAINNIWRTELQPKAFSIKQELLRRIYGQGPYPNSGRSPAIDFGMLAGATPLTDAALELDSLIRMLPG